MKISTKLFAGTALLLAGVVAIGVASLYALTGVEASVHKLTEESAPLQLKTLELQQTIEKLSAGFFKLGLSADAAQAEQLSHAIDADIATIVKLRQDIARLENSQAQADPGEFREVHGAVMQAVQQRLHDTGVFRSESSGVDQVLKAMGNSIAAIKTALEHLNGDAATVVAKAQQSNLVSSRAIE
ncbi:MAG: MCP four helix bundle domain-containing protein [Nevskia sp.]|nr:MCP four helix bundle domain-containing protein [Nevskia sp.]